MFRQLVDSARAARTELPALWGAVKSICLVALAILSFVACMWVVMAVVCAVQNLVS